ncbi:hypothetical protein [Streptomyces sirii]|uniref:hypothetical protein n=1 Tax=Streptomyces sirii TaxID=3127701 RepID=UPI003D3658B1
MRVDTLYALQYMAHTGLDGDAGMSAFVQPDLVAVPESVRRITGKPKRLRQR